MSVRLRWSPPVSLLISVVGLLSILVPFLLLGALRVFTGILILDTERSLIAEAVVVGELYRQQTAPETATGPLEPPLEEHRRFAPLIPRLDLTSSPVLPPSTRVGTSTRSRDPLSFLLARTRVRNLAAVRVLDAKGQVIASPTQVVGYRLDHLPEVAAALVGDYAPALRRRFSDDPPPPLSSLSRAGNARVSIAVPIFVDPRGRPGEGAAILGVVYNARTPLEPSKAFWVWRRRLYPPLLASIAIVLAVAVFLSFTIRRPLARLRRYAEVVAAGRSVAPYRSATVEPAEVRALAASLEKMRVQLEARADYIREFAANAVHELKTPLTSLRGASELLLEDATAMSETQRARFLSNIQSDALRMDRLVTGILELARIESMIPQPVQGTSLSDMVSGLKERYRRRGHDLQVECPAGIDIDVGSDLLESLLSNLLDNAVRHGAGHPVDLTVQQDETHVRIRVRDRGPPLPPGRLDRVFERFYSTERESGGTGLGLAIVRAVAEAHGGSVSARALRPTSSMVGGPGAEFTVAFPARAIGDG